MVELSGMTTESAEKMFEAYEQDALDRTAPALRLEATALETKTPADIAKADAALRELAAVHQRAAVHAPDRCAEVRHREGYEHIGRQRAALRKLGGGKVGLLRLH